MTDTYSVNDHFADKDPIVRALYNKLLEILNGFGLIIEEPKKSSIHLVRKSALAGVETLGQSFSSQSQDRVTR